MNISYRFASAEGEVVARDALLDRPFSVGPGEYHPFMTLRDFFDAIRSLVLSEKGGAAGILASLLGRPVSSEEIADLVIRYEKYGTLYQICSIDISGETGSATICASAALSEEGKETLEEEFRLLSLLKQRDISFLPRVFRKGSVEVDKTGGRATSLLVVLLEWFAGYEEWHFQLPAATRAFLWDMRGGYRLLSEGQTGDIIRQAAQILTLYYDVESGRRIIPWHHGGGDFVVRAGEAGVDVRLVTARGYEPLRVDGQEGLLQRLGCFFLETVTKMRLDKEEGMGQSIWADRAVLDAAITGFLEGLGLKESRGEMGLLTKGEVLTHLRSLDTDFLRALLRQLSQETASFDSSDRTVLLARLDGHAAEISAAVHRMD